MSGRRLAAALGAASVLAAGVPASAAPPGYEEASAATLVEGREVVALARAGDVDGLFERFAPELAADLTEDDVRQTLGATLSTAGIGDAVGESALPLAPRRRLYLADLRWGTGTLAFVLVLGSSGEITGIDLRARRPLPRDPRAGRRPKARLTLPVTGEWWVRSGAGRPSGRTTTSSPPISGTRTTSSSGGRARPTAARA
jgi:hypothetical protein